MDLSNKSLALLLLAAIVISLGGTIVSLNKLSQVQVGIPDSPTALVPGWTAVNITESVGCAIDYNVDFGEDTPGNKNLSSNINNVADGFNNCISGNTCSGMQVNNTGNVNLNVNFSSNQGASAFLGGASVAATDFRFNMTNGTQPGAPARGGCFNVSGTTGWGAYVNIVASTQNVVCQNLSYGDSNDIVNIEYNVNIRPDTPVGAKNATITVNCNQI